MALVPSFKSFSIQHDVRDVNYGPVQRQTDAQMKQGMPCSVATF